jgi:hypothetical protein
MPAVGTVPGAIEPAQRFHYIVDGNRIAGAWRAPERRLAFDRRAIGRPGCEDGALHFRLKLRMPGNGEGIDQRTWVRHDISSFLAAIFVSSGRSVRDGFARRQIKPSGRPLARCKSVPRLFYRRYVQAGGCREL